MSEAEAWFDAEWSDPEPSLTPATVDSIMAACTDIFNEHDLEYIRNGNLDVQQLAGYIDGMFGATRHKDTAANFLRQHGLAVPVNNSPRGLFDRITSVVEKRGGTLAIGALVIWGWTHDMLAHKEYVAWPSDTKTELARVAEPTALRVAGRIVSFRKDHPNEVLIRSDPTTPGGIELELDSFDAVNYYHINAYMLKDHNNNPDPKTIDYLSVYTGSYLNDGSGAYDGDKSLRQEVDLYTDDDVSGTKVWEVEDWQWDPGASGTVAGASMHIDSLDWSKIGSPSSVSPSAPMIKEAEKENVIFAKYLEVEVNEALSGDIQEIKKGKSE